MTTTPAYEAGDRLYFVYTVRGGTLNAFDRLPSETTQINNPSDIPTVNTVTAADIAAIMEVNTRFDKFAVAVGSGSPSGDMLKEIPDCKTFLRELDLATQAISAADGTDELDGAN